MTANTDLERCNPKENDIKAQFKLCRPKIANYEFSLNANVTMPGRGVTAIFGNSGSGKTTFLRCIAGLEKAAGNLEVNGHCWQSDKRFMPAHRRPIGYVFQESSLFPHMTARQNLHYAIRRSEHGHSSASYDSIIHTLGIETVLQRFPHELSGGERQRIAIARALLIQPQLLLMDEPLASLDMSRKQEILPYLEKLCTNSKIPILYVSHSIDEVARLAEHVVVFEKGVVTASGTVTEIFSRINPTLQRDDELGVLLQGKVVERDETWHLSRIAFEGGDLWLRDGGDEIGSAVRVRVLARDVSVALENHTDTSILNRLRVEVAQVLPSEDDTICIVRLRAKSSYIIARLTAKSVHSLKLVPGMQVWAQIKSVALVR